MTKTKTNHNYYNKSTNTNEADQDFLLETYGKTERNFIKKKLNVEKPNVHEIVTCERSREQC